MKKRIFAAGIVFGFLLSSISGCGHKTEPEENFVITGIEVMTELEMMDSEQNDLELPQSGSEKPESETAGSERSDTETPESGMQESEMTESEQELEEQEIDIVSKNNAQENDAAETESLTDLEATTDPVVETEMQTETKTAADIQNSETFAPEKQFRTCAKKWPEASKVGVIYSAGNKKAKKQLKKARELAKEYGMELITAKIQEKIDIDLEASQLVGQADVIFCLDDELVNELIPTICAYAKEVEIPVLSMEGNVISNENHG